MEDGVPEKERERVGTCSTRRVPVSKLTFRRSAFKFKLSQKSLKVMIYSFAS